MITKHGVTYVSAAQFVAHMAKKYGANKRWVWDVLEEEFNIIKGTGGVMNLLETQEAEYIIKTGLE